GRRGGRAADAGRARSRAHRVPRGKRGGAEGSLCHARGARGADLAHDRPRQPEEHLLQRSGRQHARDLLRASGRAGDLRARAERSRRRARPEAVARLAGRDVTEACGCHSRLGIDRVAVSDDVLVKLTSVSIPTISQILKRRGYGNAFLSGVTSRTPQQNLVGRAFTARTLPTRKDVAATQAGAASLHRRAFGAVQPGGGRGLAA